MHTLQGDRNTSSVKVCMQAVKAALRDPQNAEDPQLRREYFKLFKQLTKISDVSFMTPFKLLVMYCCFDKLSTIVFSSRSKLIDI